MNDGVIRAAIEAGAADLEALAQLCQAGSACGGCLPTLEALLRTASTGVDDGRRQPNAA